MRIRRKRLIPTTLQLISRQKSDYQSISRTYIYMYKCKTFFPNTQYFSTFYFNESQNSHHEWTANNIPFALCPKKILPLSYDTPIVDNCDIQQS